ncbi:MAG: hypothetical protein Rhims3KO_14470 [Hyphomicrobiales bacterium]
MRTVETCYFSGKFLWDTMPPPRPETALATIAAGMRAPPGKLDNNGTLTAPVGIVGKIDQFPTDPVSIQINNHFARKRSHRRPCASISNASHIIQRPVLGNGPNEIPAGFFPFAANNNVELLMLAKDVSPVIGRENTPIDYQNIWTSCLGALCNVASNWMSRC